MGSAASTRSAVKAKALRIRSRAAAGKTRAAVQHPVVRENAEVLIKLFDQLDPSKVRDAGDVTGDVELAFAFKEQALVVHVKRARGLVGRDSGGKSSDPFAVVSMEPEVPGEAERRTQIQRGTLNPVFDEELRFPMSASRARNSRVRVKLFDWDRFSSDQFCGQVLVDVPPDAFDRASGGSRDGDPLPKWHALGGMAEDIKLGEDSAAIMKQELHHALNAHLATLQPRGIFRPGPGAGERKRALVLTAQGQRVKLYHGEDSEEVAVRRLQKMKDDVREAENMLKAQEKKKKKKKRKKKAAT